MNQRLLPAREEVVTCRDVPRLVKAIATLEVRGAPALGVAGGFGVVLAALRAREKTLEAFLSRVTARAEELRSTRPTAVNLGGGIDRVLSRVLAASSIEEARRTALEEALALAREDAETCQRLGEVGAALLPDSCTLLTHCNAGALACTRWGTALGVVRSAVAQGKEVRVIACETRPLFQGSRLTAWELERDGIDVTVIPDSAAASLMRQGEIDLVLVGADRVTREVVFNKVGTYLHALCARHHDLPFYVAAPLSTFDLDRAEHEVVVEERDREELARCGDRLLVPPGVRVVNPAFDATPLSLVSGVITEQELLFPPLDPWKIRPPRPSF